MSAAEPDADVVSILHQAASNYARHGIHIFPCQPRGKTPATGHGYLDATTDPEKVDAWWRETPDANIGIALGATGAFIVDVDGPEAATYLAQLEDEHGPLPDTYSITTGRTEGGRHLMFHQPQGRPAIGNRKIGAGGKLETRGDGGYAIAPPSIHPTGAPYTANGKWRDIAHAPEWLLDLCTKQQPAKSDTPAPVPTMPTSDGERSALSIAGRVAMGTEGNRNHLLYWGACKIGSLIAASRITEEYGRQLLTGAAERAGLSAHETAATIESGLVTGYAEPEYANPFTTDAIPPVTVLHDDPHPHVEVEGRPASLSWLDGLPTDPSLLDPDNHLDRAVLDEYIRLVARKHAQVMDVATTAPEPPPLRSLSDLLSEPDPEIQYRLDGLWPQHGRVLLAAQYKAGKSTLIGNLVRSLVDGTLFLGEHAPTPLTGRVVIIDDELHQDTLRRWYREQQIVHTETVDVVCLRGKTSTFNILDAHVRTQWATRIRAAGAEVVIFDCLRPILDACGLSEDKDAGRFLVAFDELCDEAGVTEAVVVHHMGHSGERSRGDSRLRDWPDVEWRLIRDGEDGENEQKPPRYFVAQGRDVNAPERLLAFDETTKNLTIVGGSRKQEDARWAMDAVLTFIDQAPDNPSQRAIASGVGKRASSVRDVIEDAVGAGLVEIIGVGKTNAHRLTPAGQHWLRNPRGVA